MSRKKPTTPQTMNTLEDVYRKYPIKTLSKFTTIAKRYGFTAQEAKDYLHKHVVHEQKIPPPQYMHIYSKTPNAFQMDTFINDKRKGGTNYLMFINVNTRKAFSYNMYGKGTASVIRALNKFIHDEADCKSILSDQDSAYLSKDVLTWMKEHDINYMTTEDEDHNKLGIINRFMRTIRGMASNKGYDTITPQQMDDIIDAYNNTPHRSLGDKTPNEITPEDEQEYIKSHEEDNPYDFEEGEKVRVVLDKQPLVKRRSRLTKEAYIIDSRVGNQFLIKSKDSSVDKVPGYKLIKSNKNVPIADTLKQGKRGIIEHITGYNAKNDKYNIVYEGGVRDIIPAINLREGNPTKLSRMEREYWIKHQPIPASIRKWL